MNDEIYLGDGVYAGHDNYNIWVWVSDGLRTSDRVALEPAVLDALFTYRQRLLDRVRAARVTMREDTEDADAEASR